MYGVQLPTRVEQDSNPFSTRYQKKTQLQGRYALQIALTMAASQTGHSRVFGGTRSASEAWIGQCNIWSRTQSAMCLATIPLSILLAICLHARELPTDHVSNAPLPAESSYQGVAVDALALASSNRYALNLDFPTLSEQERNDIESSASSIGPEIVGIHRSVPPHFSTNLNQDLTWLDHRNGRTAYLELRSPDALTLRAAFRLKLPKGSRILFYEIARDGTAAVISDSTGAFLKISDEGVFWSPVAEDDQLGVEIQVPSTADLNDVHIELTKISFGFRSVESYGARPRALECDNHIDAVCAIDDGETTQATADTVLRIRFEEGEFAYVCSAALMSNTGDQDPPPPYVLTAHHCIPNATVASTVIAYWFYQRSTCDEVGTDSRYTTTAGGATLLATRSSEDMTLMQMNSGAPAGISFAGWDTTTSISRGDELYGISHPDGTIKKFWEGNVGLPSIDLNVCEHDGSCFPVLDMFEIRASQGALEGGSSGGPAFLPGTDHVVGVFSASNLDCENRQAFFGKFSNFYSHVEEWLDPTTDDHGDDTATASSVEVNSSTPGSIEEDGDIDYFQIDVTSSGELTVYTTGSIDTKGELFNSTRTVQSDDDDSGSDTNFRIVEDVSPDTYYAVVEGRGDTVGDYTFHVEYAETVSTVDDHGDDATSASTLLVNSNETGVLGTADDIDVFEIVLSEDGELKIYTEGTIDTNGRLFNLETSVDVADDDSADNENFEIAHDLTAGTYYVEVKSDQGETGSYKIYSAFAQPIVVPTDDHGNDPSTATTIPVNSTVAGNIEESGDTDVFRLSIAAAGTLLTYTTGDTDTRGTLTSADASINHSDDDGGSGENFRISVDVPSGEFYVHVRGAGTTTGGYRLHAEHQVPEEDEEGEIEDDHSNDESNATSVALNSTIDGNLELANDTDVFRFETNASGTLRIFTSGSTNTRGRLRSSDGSVDQSNDDGGTDTNFLISVEAEASVFYVHVSGNGNATGRYVLNIEYEQQVEEPDEEEPPPSDDHGDTAETATTINMNESISGSIEESGDKDVFALYLNRKGELTANTTGFMDTVGHLFNDELSVSRYNDDGGSLRNFKIVANLNPGFYYIEVSGYDTSTGTYELHTSFELDPNIFQLSTASNSIEEHERSFVTIVASNEREIEEERIVNLTLSGAATLGSDYVLEPSSIIIPPGESEGTAKLIPIRDWVREGDEDVSIEANSEFAEEAERLVERITVMIQDQFEGDGDSIVPNTGYDVVPSIDLRGGENTLGVRVSVRNLAFKQSSSGSVYLKLYEFPQADDDEPVESQTATFPQLASINSTSDHTFEITLADLTRNSVYIGRIDLELTDPDSELNLENNSVQFGFALDSERHLKTTCNRPVRSSPSDTTDPLTADQWHISNSGTITLSDIQVVEGADLRMSETMAEPLDGSGVTVAILDTGIEVCHPEIEANVDAEDSFNFRADATTDDAWHDAAEDDPFNPDITGDHGTAAAGIIAAVKDNGRGGRGVAPSATLKGFNYLQKPSLENLSRSIKGSDDEGTAHIFNLGFNEVRARSYDEDRHLLLGWATKNLRGGKGAVFVKAAGDTFNECRTMRHPIHPEIGCMGSNADPANNIPFGIVVGAFNAKDERASYSSIGSNLWIVAPSGETGALEAGLVTTDQHGTDRGYGTVVNDLLWNQEDKNPHHDYTGSFVGTRGSVASVSGAIAILLEVDSDLTFRDVKHILASTARMPQSELQPVRVAIAGVPYELLGEWTTNSAGFRYHNAFGFGAIDLDAAVNLAEGYEANSLGMFAITEWMGESATSEGTGTLIPDADGAGLTDTMNVMSPISYVICDDEESEHHCVDEDTTVDSEDADETDPPLSEAAVNIEAVQLRINVLHPRFSDIGIQLVSPSGTRSTVNAVFNNILTRASGEDQQWVFLSNAFYGEDPRGEWQLKLVDGLEGELGELVEWELRFFVGQHPEPDDTTEGSSDVLGLH